MLLFLYNFLSFLIIFSFSHKAIATGPDSGPEAMEIKLIPAPSIEAKYPKQILNLSTDERISTNALLADKTKRQLSVIDLSSLSQGAIKDQYTIDIGKKSGDKTKRNDKRTPEGIYRLLERKAPPEIPFETYGSMAFTTNYPNYFDKFQNKTGDGIWLHSVPDKVPLTRGSRGCVVLRNNDIKKIESTILLNKTFLVIDNKIDWISAEEHVAAKDYALEWFNQWRTHWQNQDLENYIEKYSSQFQAPPFNKKTWLAHKQKLKERYSYVKVRVSDPNIFQLKNQYLIQFVQEYESDGYSDVGVKTLYVIKENGTLKIRREEWAPLVVNMAHQQNK
ncbi:hypothetical protein A11Q_842 [Pseudobdellovibrio exovorus JSS]|uniref:L,D-TPase catalytic domain-containing protein n=2 Tax=Pseudobdellovibrio exovorus TaxID=453816 RepID=M4V9E3_9BACT|nr:hypothetical protein A11Q_842 [Pseudobdellovibrio exovorus JSS]